MIAAISPRPGSVPSRGSCNRDVAGCSVRLVTTLADATTDASRLAGALLYTEPPRRRESDIKRGVFIIDLHIQATHLQRISAPMQAIQLAFDAASLAGLHPEALDDRTNG